MNRTISFFDNPDLFSSTRSQEEAAKVKLLQSQVESLRDELEQTQAKLTNGDDKQASLTNKDTGSFTAKHTGAKSNGITDLDRLREALTDAETDIQRKQSEIEDLQKTLDTGEVGKVNGMKNGAPDYDFKDWNQRIQEMESQLDAMTQSLAHKERTLKSNNCDFAQLSDLIALKDDTLKLVAKLNVKVKEAKLTKRPTYSARRSVSPASTSMESSFAITNKKISALSEKLKDFHFSDAIPHRSASSSPPIDPNVNSKHTTRPSSATTESVVDATRFAEFFHEHCRIMAEVGANALLRYHRCSQDNDLVKLPELSQLINKCENRIKTKQSNLHNSKITQNALTFRESALETARLVEQFHHLETSLAEAMTATGSFKPVPDSMLAKAKNAQNRLLEIDGATIGAIPDVQQIVSDKIKLDDQLMDLSSVRTSLETEVQTLKKKLAEEQKHLESQNSELRRVQGECDRAVSELRQSHDVALQDADAFHEGELLKLNESFAVQLEEEKDATRAALDCLRKAHEYELEREVAKLRDEYTAGYMASENPSHGFDELSHSYSVRLEEVGRELAQLSTSYSNKCIENSILNDELNKAKAMLYQKSDISESVLDELAESKSRIHQLECLVQSKIKECQKLKSEADVKDAELHKAKESIAHASPYDSDMNVPVSCVWTSPSPESGQEYQYRSPPTSPLTINSSYQATGSSHSVSSGSGRTQGESNQLERPQETFGQTVLTETNQTNGLDINGHHSPEADECQCFEFEFTETDTKASSENSSPVSPHNSKLVNIHETGVQIQLPHHIGRDDNFNTTFNAWRSPTPSRRLMNGSAVSTSSLNILAAASSDVSSSAGMTVTERRKLFEANSVCTVGN